VNAPDLNRPRVVTFGCRLNAFESEVLRERLEGVGADAIVVNTCAVTAEATRQARQTIRKLRRENPSARIVVTGCAAQVDAAAFAAMPEVDRVVGNRAKLDPRALFAGERVSVPDVMDGMPVPAATPARFRARARAFLQIQQGCDHRCTFCIVPFARGPSRSVPLDAVAERARALVAAGHVEVVLTGVDISSWGADLTGRPALGALVRGLLRAVPELRRLRLSSLDPAVMDDDLFRALAEEERLMPHLHLSLQSLDDLILKRMKRRHGRKDAAAFVARARRTTRSDVRRRPDRRLSDRKRGDVRKHGTRRCRTGPDVPARFSLFAPSRHAGRAHARGADGGPQGTRAGFAPMGRSGPGAIPAVPRRRRRRGVGGE